MAVDAVSSPDTVKTDRDTTLCSGNSTAIRAVSSPEALKIDAKASEAPEAFQIYERATEPLQALKIDGTTSEFGTKRRADSLFVHEDEDEVVDRGLGDKRVKLEESEFDETQIDLKDTLVAPATDLIAPPAALPSSIGRLGDELLAGLHIDAKNQVAPYVPSASAARDRLAIYHPSFKEAENIVADICDEMLRAVELGEASGFTNSEINNICDTIRSYLNLSALYPAIHPVALLGEAGMGKSSFLSSVLGIRNIAPQSHAKRGTYVVHEYTAARKGQTALYEIDALYYTRNQLLTRVRKHAQAIREDIAPTTSYDDQETEEAYGTALTFFHTLLCEYREFTTEEDIRDYFEATMDTDFDLLVERLTNNIEEFKANRAVEGTECHTAEDNAELTERFQRVSDPQPIVGSRGPKAHPWPALRRVQVRYSHDLLNSGTTIADLPGISDTNESVKDGSIKALQSAGTVLVFAHLQRADTNKHLDDILRTCMDLGKRDKISVVLTKIDAEAQLQDKERVQLAPSELEELERAEKLSADLVIEGERLSREMDVADEQDDFGLYRKLKKDFRDIPAKIALAKARIEQFVIEWRNREMAYTLKNKFRKLEKSSLAPDLPVYCISSTQYMLHLEGYKMPEQKPPCLDVAGTGIETLKDLLYKVPSRGKVTTLSNVALTMLPDSLSALVGVLTKSPLTRKTHVEDMIRRVLSQRAKVLEDVKLDVNRLFKIHIKVLFDTRAAEWQDQTAPLVEEWGNCKMQTFLAFCRRAGHWHLSKRAPDISWSGQVQGIFHEEVRCAFDALITDFQSVHANAEVSVQELFGQVKRDLQTSPDFQGHVANAMPFFRQLDHTTEAAHKAMKKPFVALNEEIFDIRRSAVIIDNKKHLEASYVSRALASTYSSCLLLTSGPGAQPKRGKRGAKSGVHGDRVKLLADKLSGGNGETSVFESVLEIVQLAFDNALAIWETEFERQLNRGAGAVLENFNNYFQVSDVKIEESTEVTEMLKAKAGEMLSKCEGPLKTHIKLLQAHEKTGPALK